MVETTQDRKWRIESDARSLLEAQEIRQDKTRYVAAKRELTAIVTRAKKEALAKEVGAKLEKAISED